MLKIVREYAKPISERKYLNHIPLGTVFSGILDGHAGPRFSGIFLRIYNHVVALPPQGTEDIATYGLHGAGALSTAYVDDYIEHPDATLVIKG
jgi:hypothetical protein